MKIYLVKPGPSKSFGYKKPYIFGHFNQIDDLCLYISTNVNLMVL